MNIVGNCVADEPSIANIKLLIFEVLHGIGIPITSVKLNIIHSFHKEP